MARRKQELKKETTPKKQCLKCGKFKAAVSSNFYRHAENQFKPLDGLHQVCCSCIDEQIDDSNIETVYEVLKHLDRPFLSDRWNSSIEESKNRKANGSNGWGVWKCYMKNISMKEVIHYTWKDSSFGSINKRVNDQIENNVTNENISVNLNVTEDESKSLDELGYSLEELKEKYGYGYPDNEYYLFEKKYQQLRPSFQLLTTMHEEYFQEYCINKVKETLAKARGDFKEAKEWAAMVKDVAEAGKLKPSQMSKADLSGGMDTFGQLARLVEENYEIMPILPKFTEQPKDKVDIVLWCYINYVRDLKGMPECEYNEIYQFYDAKREDYEKQMADMNKSGDSKDG